MRLAYLRQLLRRLGTLHVDHAGTRPDLVGSPWDPSPLPEVVRDSMLLRASPEVLVALCEHEALRARKAARRHAPGLCRMRDIGRAQFCEDIACRFSCSHNLE